MQTTPIKKLYILLLLMAGVFLWVQCDSEMDSASEDSSGEVPFSAAMLEEAGGGDGIRDGIRDGGMANGTFNGDGRGVSIGESGGTGADRLGDGSAGRSVGLREFGGNPVASLTAEISSGRETAITRAVERASASIVSMLVTHRARPAETLQEEIFRRYFGLGPSVENQTMGSGFIISEDGLVVTNQHVVGAQPSGITISTIDGKSYPARLIGSDQLTDLALLKIESDTPFSYVEFSDSDEVLVGEWAIALGNPFALFQDGLPTVTVGVISAKNRDFNPDPESSRIYIDMIQTDAAINRGNSGGPLLNANGEVIGINTFIYTVGASEGFVGLGFAIPSNRIEHVISQLLISGSVVLDYDMGMEFSSMTRQLINRYQLPYIHGLLVTSVNQHGPAYEGGILPGDIILQVDDARVVSKTHALALMREYREGDLLPVTLLRNGVEYEAEVHLRKKLPAPPNSSGNAVPPGTPGAPGSSGSSGSSITPGNAVPPEPSDAGVSSQ